MCGRCRNVFNAFESLKRIEDNEEARGPAPTDTRAKAAESREPPDYPSFDTDTRGEPPADLLPAFTAANETELSAEVPYQTGQALETAGPFPAQLTAAIEEAPAFTQPLTVSPAEAPPPFLLADPVSGALQQENADDAAEVGDVADNPLLRQAYRPDRPPRRALWIVGIAVLLMVIIAQTIYFFRANVMEMYPQARPYLVKSCELAGCVIAWGRDDGAIKIEASDLIESPVKPGRILLTATLVNRGKAKQELPAIELRLTDNGNQVLASRILQPRDYLGRVPSQDEGLVPNAELFVNLNFEIANKTPASGYGLRAFYP